MVPDMVPSCRGVPVCISDRSTRRPPGTIPRLRSTSHVARLTPAPTLRQLHKVPYGSGVIARLSGCCRIALAGGCRAKDAGWWTFTDTPMYLNVHHLGSRTWAVRLTGAPLIATCDA